MSKAWRQDISVGRRVSETELGSAGGVIVRLLVWEGELGEDLSENHDEDDDDLEGAVDEDGVGWGAAGSSCLPSDWNMAMNFWISGSMSESFDAVLDDGGVDAGAWEACPGAGDLGGDGEAQSQPILSD